jgi:Na+-transporting NADH:ubiquinone oxidoreductase subunit NqrB
LNFYEGEEADIFMAERIVGLVCCWLCAFPFLVIGIYNKDSNEPITFWSGDNTLKEKIKDIKNYNIEMADLYKKCAIVFFLTGILFVIAPFVGVIFVILDCTAGIYVAYRFYKKILEKYS